jgi:hypothetical protein
MYAYRNSKICHASVEIGKFLQGLPKSSLDINASNGLNL